MPSPKVSDEDLIKAYYQAHKNGDSLSALAERLGMNYMAVYSRVARFKKKRGMNLPALKGQHDAPHAAATAKTRAPKPPVTPISAEDFIRIWQTAESAAEVAEKTGIRWDMARSRAQKLIRKGVPLKNIKLDPRGSALNLPALIELAKSLAPQEPTHVPA